MKTRTSASRTSLAVALATLMSCPADAQHLAWRSEIASQSDTPVFNLAAIETEPGRVLLAQRGDPGSSASWWLDNSEILPSSINGLALWGVGFRLWEGFGLDVVVAEIHNSWRPLTTDLACSREHLPGGLVLRTHRQIGFGGIDGGGSQLTDPDGSSFELTRSGLDQVMLLRRDADCSGRVLAEWQSTSAWLIDGVDPGITFVVRDEPLTVQPGGSELLRLQGEDVTWTRDFVEPGAGRRRIAGAVAMPDGGVAVFAVGQASELVRLDADGATLWQVPIDAVQGLLASSGDGLHVLTHELVFSPGWAWGQRLGFDLDGHSLGSGPIPSGLALQPLSKSPWRSGPDLWPSFRSGEGQRVHRLSTEAGFELLAGPFPTERALLELGDGSILLASGDGRSVRRIDAHGAPLGDSIALPALPAGVVDVSVEASDASGLLISSFDYSDTGRELRAHDAQGGLAWKIPRADLLDGTWGALAIGADPMAPICAFDAEQYHDDFRLACIDRRTAEARFAHLTLQGTGAGRMAGVLPQGDGSVVVLRIAAGDARLQRMVVGSTGAIGDWTTVLETPLSSIHSLARGAQGQDGSRFRLARIVGEPRNRLLRHSDSGLGAQLAALPAPWSSIDRGGLRAAVDGGALLFERTVGENGLELLRLDADLGLKWQASLPQLRFLGPDGGSPPTPPRGSDPEVVQVGPRWFAWGWSVEGMLRIVALDDADGSVLWQRDIRHRFSGDEDPILADDGRGRLLLARSRRDAAELSWLDPADGSTLWATRIAQAGRLASIHLAPDGAIRLLSHRDPRHGVPSQRALVTQIDSLPYSLPAAPAVAQPALQGAWYDPSASGQGLFLDVLPEADTVAGAWFTFSTEGGHARRQQRWYTLHADAAAGSEDVTLDIRRSAGGRFAQGPAVDSVAVGSARLRLLDCDRALLDYAFEDEDSDGLPGTILLQRLTPRAADCGEANGAAADARSGFWYDPASSGQGLVLSAFPAAPDPAGGVFAAWFTFDPDGLADDPHAQHWFSLVGEETLPDGAIRARLLRTIGGSFDDAATSNTEAVGEVHLRFDGCDALTLDYAFDEGGFAAEFAALAGSQTLRRIGGCQ